MPLRRADEQSPSVRAVAERVEHSRERARPGQAEVPTDVALTVVVGAIVCCTVGWLVAPVGRRPDLDTSWYAQIVGTVFWAAALVAVVGLYLRLRRGLLAALVCSMSFLAAVAIDAVLDPTVLGVRWGVEVACATLFWAGAAAALVVTDRERSARRSREGRAARRSHW